MPLLVVVSAAAMSVVIGLVSGAGWAGFVLGAASAVTLWLIIFCGTLAGPRDRSPAERVPARVYAVAAVAAVVLGGAAFWIIGTLSAWSVGVIMAGLLAPAGDRARRDLASS